MDRKLLVGYYIWTRV